MMNDIVLNWAEQKLSVNVIRQILKKLYQHIKSVIKLYQWISIIAEIHLLVLK